MIDWGYWADKAQEYTVAGRYYDAISCYERLLEDDPRDDFALTMIGGCYSELGQFNQAVTYVNRALDIRPWYYFNWYNKGMVYYKNKMYFDAIRYFDEAITLNAEDAVSWYFKGWSYYELRDIPQAIECFEKSYNLDHDEKTRDLINDIRRRNLYSGPSFTTGSGKVQCPNCGRYVNESAVSCGFCGHRLTGGSGSSSSYGGSSGSGGSSNYGKVQCPSCGRYVSKYAVSCGFCGYSFTGGNSITKKCPNCGTAVRRNKKVCPKCNYNFKKSKVDAPKKNDTPKRPKSTVNKSTGTEHFDDGIVSFDYPNNYSQDFNSKYEEMDVLASFKDGSSFSFNSSFAVFKGEVISNEIPDSKFKEVIKKSSGADVLEINRSSSGDKERIVIKTKNRASGNIEYICHVPQIGFSVLFFIPDGNEYSFDENAVSIVVDSLEKSTGVGSRKKSTGVGYSEKSSFASSFEEPSSGSSFVEPPEPDFSHILGQDYVTPKKETIICPNCGNENSDDSNFCIVCGTRLDVAKDVHFCIYCGTEIVPGARFCMNCGKLIDF